jgi:selenide,water dikinase
VYRLSDDQALVVTADFITPPFDDARLFGQIAAANALSDVYAMGGRPVTCVNLVAFPSKKLGPEVLAGIIEGASEKIREAGAVLAGGHTVEDPEPKFGLAVTGLVHPDRMWQNSTARPGDVLILTKAVGSGVLLNANLKGWVADEDLSACRDTLVTLNRTAAEIAAEFEVHAATDVTGFGLAGHALEMARGSNAQLRITFHDLPLLSGALAMYAKGMATGSNESNRALAGAQLGISGRLTREEEELLFDPQTNGGLLIAVAAGDAQLLCQKLTEAGVESARCIGEVVERGEGPLLDVV